MENVLGRYLEDAYAVGDVQYVGGKYVLYTVLSDDELERAYEEGIRVPCDEVFTDGVRGILLYTSKDLLNEYVDIEDDMRVLCVGLEDHLLSEYGEILEEEGVLVFSSDISIDRVIMIG